MVNKNLHLCFETLANPLRMRIIQTLEEKPMSVTQMAKELDVERTRLSHALAVLRNCNFVKMDKLGKQRVYSVNKETILHNTEKHNNGIFTIIKEHKRMNCTTCHKSGLTIEGKE